MTIRRFEALAHDLLRPPLDTVVMVAGAAIVVGKIIISSPNDMAFDAAILPLIVALAIAARVGREVAHRRRGENSSSTSAIGMSRFLYLGCAALAAIMTVVIVMTTASPRLFEMLGVQRGALDASRIYAEHVRGQGANSLSVRPQT